MLGMLGYGLVPLSGRELVSSFVKTDIYWSFRMLALLELLLLRKASLILGGETPIASC